MPAGPSTENGVGCGGLVAAPSITISYACSSYPQAWTNMCTKDSGTVRDVLTWVRRWRYKLVWQDGHTGRLGGEVETAEQLRAVVAWAQRNPRVRRWSFEPVDHLDGEPRWTDVCPRGHPLITYPRPERREGWLPCAGCPGHHRTVCTTCGVRLIEPEPGGECGPPADWVTAPPHR